MIEVHTLGWVDDRAVEGTQKPVVSLLVRVFLDGVEVENVMRAHVRYGPDFTTTTLILCQPVEVVTHNDETWKALG